MPRTASGLFRAVTNRFAPDFDDYPTLEIPDLRRRAQKLLHEMVGADISPEEYLEKLELIETCLRDTYQEAIGVARIKEEYRVQELQRQLSRVTRRPAKTDPGIGIPTIPPPAALPELEIDWSDYVEPEDDK